MNTMTDEDTIEAVTTKLTGEFFVGQRVRVNNPDSHFHGATATITETDHLGGSLGARLKLDPGHNVSVLRPWYRFEELMLL